MSTWPTIVSGAVYFRKSNPPPADWARDYAVAAADGMNAFRHWFMWSAIETRPGVYDWADYDRQLDLAAEHGLTTIIAERMEFAPEWAYRRHADARLETRDGRRLDSITNPACAVGGSPGLCLDHAGARAAAENFLRALVLRYRAHPGLGGYDLWNECFFHPHTCYCPATAERFRAWLQERYGGVRVVAEAWRCYGLVEWEDVLPPRYDGAYPARLDWLEFRVDNAHRWIRHWANLIRELDPQHPVIAHGIAQTLNRHSFSGCDDWRAAAEVDSYGFTYVAGRQGDAAWKHCHAVDLVRAAARGKPFWHAEAQGGPLWSQSGRPREDGLIATAEDVRCWNLTSLMGGVTGILYPRWRPLLDGPLFGAFGPYAMDGSRTPRSEMSSRVARWANAPDQRDLWRSRPVRGEVGIVFSPESERFLYAQNGPSNPYADMMRGAYRGFFDCHVQPDWVHVDDAFAPDGPYRVLYLPGMLLIGRATAARLRAWVEAGGRLIAEGCPGYFTDGGRVRVTEVPGERSWLAEVFGARESEVEFIPDLLRDLRFTVDGVRGWGGWCLQTYAAEGGTAAGWYEDGRIAVVDHQLGRGRTRLIGTQVGLGQAAHPGLPELFPKLLAWAGVAPHLTCSDPQFIARLHDGPGGTYLWVLNPTRADSSARIELGATWGPFRAAQTLWGGQASIDGRSLVVPVTARDATIVALKT